MAKNYSTMKEFPKSVGKSKTSNFSVDMNMDNVLHSAGTPNKFTYSFNSTSRKKIKFPKHPKYSRSPYIKRKKVLGKLKSIIPITIQRITYYMKEFKDYILQDHEKHSIIYN